MKSYVMILGVVLALGVILAPTARAGMVDLTTSPSDGSVNGAYFLWTDIQTTGTGVIDPFVRIQSNGTESGYNIGVRPVEFNENNSAQYTHPLPVGAVPIVSDPGSASGDYYEFLLDINQNGSNPLLSLYEMKIFLTDDPYSHSFNPSTDIFGVTTDTPDKIFDLDEGPDGDSVVELNFILNPGSGAGDMFAYIPTSLFHVGGDLGNPLIGANVILYSQFGVTQPSNDGFEEWAVRIVGEPPPPPPVIPVPGAVLLGILGLGAAGMKLRKFA